MPKVTFQNTGQNANAGEDVPLKDVVRDEGWPIMFACEDGVCGTCLIRTTAGMENLSPMDEKERETLQAMGMDPSTQRLACQCKVKGDVTIEQ
mgnify:CR=1 FL=1